MVVKRRFSSRKTRKSGIRRKRATMKRMYGGQTPKDRILELLQDESEKEKLREIINIKAVEGNITEQEYFQILLQDQEEMKDVLKIFDALPEQEALQLEDNCKQIQKDLEKCNLNKKSIEEDLLESQKQSENFEKELLKKKETCDRNEKDNEKTIQTLQHNINELTKQVDTLKSEDIVKGRKLNEVNNELRKKG